MTNKERKKQTLEKLDVEVRRVFTWMGENNAYGPSGRVVGMPLCEHTDVFYATAGQHKIKNGGGGRLRKISLRALELGIPIFAVRAHGGYYIARTEEDKVPAIHTLRTSIATQQRRLDLMIALPLPSEHKEDTHE